MIVLGAPYDNIETYTALPNPDFNDSQEIITKSNNFISMSGVRRSYVQNEPCYKLNYTFSEISHQKILELLAFIKMFGTGFILLDDHNGVRWKVQHQEREVTYQLNKHKDAENTFEYGSLSISFTGVKI